MNNQFEKSLQNLKKYWGYDAYRPGQDEVIQSVFAGNKTLVLFPTGGGKSLCYQVPATVFEGMTLVISPLVALMQDQVQQLLDRGIPATFINSTIPSGEVEQRLINARNGMYKLLYCAPERLKTSLWEHELPNLNIELVAIDEAHCISEWGHDFRPSYREIKTSLRPIAESTRWLALTATATPEVRKDILSSLEFEDAKVISHGFSRPNLKWWVISTQQKREKLIEVVSKAAKQGDGLIYGGTRKNCENLAVQFSALGIRAEAYHAGIEPKKRKAIQERWISGETPLVAATNAFGMGIDKPDCRYVIHDEMPYSLEAYYQEAGRAGRDGKESYPILLYRPSDYKNAVTRLEESYPTRKEMETVYRALCDSFELAVGSQMEYSVPVDFEQLKIRSRLSPKKIQAALRLLEKLDIIAMQEETAPAVELQFLLSRDALSQYRAGLQNADKAEFLDKLERLFGFQAFTDFVNMEEDILLDKLQINHAALVKALNVFMQSDRILNYKITSGQTLVFVLEARSSKLPLSRKQVETHRENLFQKLEYMHGFIKTEDCREVYLRHYFGDTGAKACGHCDNCLKEENAADAPITSQQIERICELLAVEARNYAQLQKESGLSGRQVLAVLNHLRNEEKITAYAEKPGFYKLLNSGAEL